MAYFDLDYFLIYHTYVNSARTKAEVNGVLEKCKPNKNSIFLDVGCAWGRHVQGLSSLGYYCTGLDSSGFFIDIAKKRSQASKIKNLKYLTGDARSLPLNDNQFDIVVNLNTNFGFFMDDNENEGVFKEIWRVLKKGGKLLFDYYNPEKYCNLPEKNWTQIEGDAVKESYKDDPILDELCNVYTGKSFYVLEESKYNVNDSILNKTRIIINDTDKQSNMKNYILRLYHLCELKKMMQTAGFSICNIYGSLVQGNCEYSINSERLVILCQK